MDHRDGVSGPFYCRETYYRKRENKMNYKLIAQIPVYETSKLNFDNTGQRRIMYSLLEIFYEKE